MDEQVLSPKVDINREITELRREIDRLKFEIERKAKQLNVKDEEIQKYVYTVSHELKTPIISMKGFTSLLLSFHEESLDEEVKDYLRRIDRNLQQMEQLINDLLEYARVQIEKEKFEAVNFQTIIEKALSEFQYQLSDSPNPQFYCLDPQCKLINL